MKYNEKEVKMLTFNGKCVKVLDYNGVKIRLERDQSIFSAETPSLSPYNFTLDPGWYEFFLVGGGGGEGGETYYDPFNGSDLNTYDDGGWGGRGSGMFLVPGNNAVDCAAYIGQGGSGGVGYVESFSGYAAAGGGGGGGGSVFEIPSLGLVMVAGGGGGGAGFENDAYKGGGGGGGGYGGGGRGGTGGFRGSTSVTGSGGSGGLGGGFSGGSGRLFNSVSGTGADGSDYIVNDREGFTQGSGEGGAGGFGSEYERAGGAGGRGGKLQSPNHDNAHGGDGEFVYVPGRSSIALSSDMTWEYGSGGAGGNANNDGQGLAGGDGYIEIWSLKYSN